MTENGNLGGKVNYGDKKTDKNWGLRTISLFLGRVLLWAYPMYLLRVSVLRQGQQQRGGQRELGEKDNDSDRDR